MTSKTSSFLVLFFSSLLSLGAGNPFVFSGKEVPLQGEWNLVMNAFLTYEEVKNDTSAVDVAVPGVWNDVLWNGKPVGAYGYGTYYSKIVISPESEHKPLAIEVPDVSLAYRLFMNDQLIGQVGDPQGNKEATKSKIDTEIFDFNAQSGDTLTIIFHVSNFEHESGGIWYTPEVDYKNTLIQKSNIDKSIKLIILGCIFISALFQILIFIRRPQDRFGLYFFLVCLSVSMLLVSIGDSTIMDIFPETSWVTIKKTLYLATFSIGATNALFLRALFPNFFNRNIVRSVCIICIGVCLFTLIARPETSYSFIVPPYHAFNILLGLYLSISLTRAAIAGMFGAKFLLFGYVAAFLAVMHDMLSTLYIIPSYSLAMVHLGIIFYILQLLFILINRYILALEGKEQLSNHLKKVNKELENIVQRRTKALSDQNEIIESKNTELQKAMQEKDHLMAVVAHDLKAPLSSILGISQLMESDLKGQSAEFNQMIKKVTIDGRNLIENLTDLKAYEHDDFKVNAQSFNLQDFFEQKKVSFGEIAKAKDIAFHTDLATNRNLFSSDPSILSRITDNLLSNAIKFTPKEGEVNFRISTTESNLVINVSDNGLGFTEQDKQKAFEKFQRLSSRPTGGESSAGLGLSIIKILTEKLGGDIVLTSEKGEGSSFTVTIPSIPAS